MTHKSGFTIIELMLGLLFGSIIATALFTAFFQLTITSKSGTVRIDIDTKVALFHHQIERDLAGLFMPQAAIPDEEENTKSSKSAPEESEKKATASKPDVSKKIEPAEAKKEKKQRKIVDKPFYSTNKDGRLEMLTFVTNNPLRFYQKADVTTSTQTKGASRTVRVTYRLVPDKNNTGAFALMRQESAQLQVQPFDGPQAPRSYELINNIKSLTFSFLQPIEEKPAPGKKSDQKKPTDTKEKKPIEYATFSIWPPEKDALELPHIIACTLELWDNTHENSYTYRFYMPYLAFQQLYPQEQDETPENEPAKPAQQQEKKISPPQSDKKNSQPAQNV